MCVYPCVRVYGACVCVWCVHVRVCSVLVCVLACVYVGAWTPLSAHGAARTWKITISLHSWGRTVPPSQAYVLKVTGP